MNQPPSTRRKNYSAFAWAIFSQSIWLPALLMDSQDRLASKGNDYSFTAQIPHQDLSNGLSTTLAEKLSHDPAISVATVQTSSSGVLLNSILPRSNQQIHSDIATPSQFSQISSPVAFSAPPPPKSLEIALQTSPDLIDRTYSLNRHLRDHQTSPDPLRRMYTSSELLGGSVSLRDLNEPEMPPIARAERAQLSRSGDPLAPIPQVWRESMRKALRSLSNVSTNPQSATEENLTRSSERLSVNPAKVVHVPSLKIRHATEVPLALQSDGTVDILNNPDDPAVVEEIKSWSTKQELPSQGRMTPAIVHLHPLNPPTEQAISPKRVLRDAQTSTQTLPPTPPTTPAPSQQPSTQAAIPEPLPLSVSGPSASVREPVSSSPNQSMSDKPPGAASLKSEVTP